ncbi:MAG: efflux RND transporter permease subunit [Candidatus Omnitrophica bacterium]|nr:efflux RND transporter permease subunit [Candidatus Omnitrophota bacterium]MDD5487353.1 efflux RND transporter permease subunit [Candidatus Omnitrophota bacterium]
MSLPRFSVNQSLFVNLVSVIIIIMGLIVLLGMNKEVFPNVNFDMVSVVTYYPGATPLDMEKLVTVPIEKELREVDGIKEMNSSSAAGISLIQIKIEPDEDDKDKVVQDIRNAVDRAKDLPRDITENPVVTEISTKQYAVIEVSLSGKMDEHKLRKYADALEDILEDIKGVAKVDKAGYRDREMRVLVYPDKLREYYVSLDEIEKALADRNISIPAGEIDTRTIEYSVRTTGEFNTAGEVEDVVIRANDSGNWLKIRDVARVEDSFKKEDVINKTLGTRSINLVVMKKESGDAIKVVDEVKKQCDKFLKMAAASDTGSLQISYVNDYSFYARRRLNVLKNNGWGSLIIVIGIMMLFLEKRVAIMAVLGIPIAFFATFMVMGMMGITINLISMFGLIIVLGMLVDDGIIVAENVYRYMEDGVPSRQAAVKGAEEVQGAVCAAVFTTIASFAPLLFMTGIIGKFIRNIPTVLIIALLASLGEALIILPCHLADFVKIKYDKDGKPMHLSKDMPWFKALINGYTKVVKGAIKRKYMVFGGMCMVFLVSVFLATNVLKFVLFPSAGINFFFIRAEAPIGTPVNRTNELIAPIEDIVSEISKEELDTFVTTVGNIQEDRHDPFSGQESNLVQITVYLTQEQDRKRTADEIIAELREKTRDIKGFDSLRFDKPQTGPPVGKAVEARVRGEDFGTLDKIAFEYMDYLKAIEGTTDVTWDHKPGKKEVRVMVDREKAALAGLSVGQIASTVRGVFRGNIATKIKPVKAENETDVTVMFDEDESADFDVFDNVLIRNQYGNLIPLKKVAAIEEVPGTTTVHHLDGKRVVTASCNVDNDKATSMKVNAMLMEKFKELADRYLGYSVKYGGEQEETMESLVALLRSFLFAFLIIYLILASFFKSLVQPAIVMLAIPFGLIGVVAAFLVHGVPFSFMAILGVVGLSGIVVNDSIVLVDFINKLRQSGLSRYDSIVKAGQMRIRPVILTTVTTAGGLSTVAYGIGGKDPFLVPMALSICWGIVFATVLTLIVIPCIYSIIDDIAIKLTHHSSMIQRERVNGNGA